MPTIKTYPMPNSAILRINAEKDSIDTSPEYQRKSDIWTLEKKQLLIDSILNEYDIPKIYLHILPKQNREEGRKYLFSWDGIPGNDNVRLIEFLKQNFNIDWAKTAKIENIDNGKIIKVSTEKNYLSLKLNDEKTEVNIEIDDGRTDKFVVKMENGKLNIYGRKYEYAIIDGRQRLETIWSFINGDFPLSEDFKYFKDENVNAASLTYPDLSKKYLKLKITFDSFGLPIVLVDTDDPDLIEDMFSRLNEAVPLNAAEKRNAFGGPMVKIINRVSITNFFIYRVSFSNNRYQHKEVSLRLLFIEYSLRTSKKLIDTKKPYLDSLVKKYRDDNSIDLPDAEELGNTVERILSEMNSVFIIKDPLLRAQSIVPIIYLLFREAINQSLLSRITRSKFDTFKKEIQENREKAEKDITNANFDLLEFDRMSQQGTNDASSIKERLKIMAEYFGIQLTEVNRLKEHVFQTIRMLDERTIMTYQQLRDVFPLDHPEDISNVLEELLREGRISGGSEGYQATQRQLDAVT